MTTIETWGAFIASMRTLPLAPRLLRKARLQQASVLAAGLAARLDPGARKIAAAIVARQRGGGGEAPLLARIGGSTGGEPGVSVHGAVFANAAASCAFDWDEILLLGHPGHSAVNVPLALAASDSGVTLERALRAQLAANEVAGRLGLATFFGPQNGQHLPFIHRAGAAAAASVVFGLDAEHAAHALAISLAQPPGALWPAFLGAIESKVLTAAQPAEAGLTAAELAAQGLRGPLDILDHPRGFFWRCSFLPVRRALGGLGRTWLTDTLQIKTHAACWYFQAPLDAADAALRELGGAALRADQVRAVRVEATWLATSVHAMACARESVAIAPNTLNFRLDLCVALLLLAGRLGPETLSEAALAAREQELEALAQKVEVVHALARSRRTILAVDQALDAAGLLAEGGLVAIARALRKARREYPDLQTPSLREVWSLLPDASRAARALRRGRGRPYDLGERASETRELALPCGGAVEVELEDGRRAQAERAVPAGALAGDDAAAETLVVAKLAHALEVGPRMSGEAAAALAARLLALPLPHAAGEVFRLLAGESSARD